MNPNRQALRDWAIWLRTVCDTEGGPDRVTMRWEGVSLSVTADGARVVAAGQSVDLELDDERFGLPAEATASAS